MKSRIACAAIAVVLCLAASLALAAPRGKEGGRSGGGRPSSGGNREGGRSGGGNTAGGHGHSAPGGNWSQRTHQSGMGANQGGHAGAGAAAANKRKTPTATGGQGAAAGAAVNKRNSPNATGAQGAAAGAAAANKRKSPTATGAQGAAAGAAAVNRNSPQYSGAQGAAAGAAAANRNSPQYSGAEGAAAGSAAVRNSYNNSNLYGHAWYGAHPGVWAPTGWAAGAAWAPTTWGAVAGYCGASATPVAYNYGTNVVNEGDNVTVDGQSVGTTAEFSQQAADLAQSGAAADVSDTDEWLPLGVFAMVRNEQQHPQLILQLAINKQGILRGNYTDELTEHTQPIHGAVDPKTQRAAWTVGDNTTSVMEAGLSNLSEGEAPALIHKNGKTDHWLLVRLDQPSEGDGAPAAPVGQE